MEGYNGKRERESGVKSLRLFKRSSHIDDDEDNDYYDDNGTDIAHLFLSGCLLSIPCNRFKLFFAVFETRPFCIEL